MTLDEVLASLKAGGALDVALPELEREIAALRGQVAEGQKLHADLTAKVGQLEAGTVGHQEALTKAQADHAAALEAAKADALARYKKAVARDDGLIEGLIHGADFDEIDKSAAAARTQLEERIKASVELVKGQAAGVVPAGGAPRTPQDMSSLSPLEKIKAGIEAVSKG